MEKGNIKMEIKLSKRSIGTEKTTRAVNRGLANLGKSLAAIGAASGALHRVAQEAISAALEFEAMHHQLMAIGYSQEEARTINHAYAALCTPVRNCLIMRNLGIEEPEEEPTLVELPGYRIELPEEAKVEV